MSSEKEPYRLEGRTALIAGPVDELSRHVAAILSAAGARVSQQLAELPLPSESIAAVEATEILILHTFVDRSLPSLPADEWESIDSLHRMLVSLPTALLAKAVSAMRRCRWGRIIFLVGDANVTPAVIAARSAQSALMRAEARQLAGEGITVNLVVAQSLHTLPSAALAQAIGAAALYFAAEESSFVTGQTLQVGVDVLKK